jgi:hypothetical protein
MNTQGFACGLSGYAALDTAFPAASSYIYVSGSSGDIVYQNTAGNPQIWPGAQQYGIYPIAATQILTSAVIDGVTKTTTATDMVYASSTKI